MFFGLSLCQGDETLSAYGAAGLTWKLTSVNGEEFASSAIIEFPQEGKIQGNAPCNTFFGTQSAPYPWFQVEKLAVTKRACPDLKQEEKFLSTLQKMTLAEVSGKVLILSSDHAEEMIFHAD